MPYDKAFIINGKPLKAINQYYNKELAEESYTSKCSFFDNEPIRKHLTYRGKRVKRGLFKTSQGLLLNADVNGALNILKKHCQKVAWNDPQSSDYVEARSTPLVSTVKY